MEDKSCLSASVAINVLPKAWFASLVMHFLRKWGSRASAAHQTCFEFGRVRKTLKKQDSWQPQAP
eukprot:3877310-Amphidinium_carterae.1